MTTTDFSQSPLVAIWETTRACDLACLHCRACATPTRDPTELSTSEAFDLLDQLQELGPCVLVLTGGDPLKRPDLFAIVEAAVARGLEVALAPSVTPLLTAETIQRLAHAGVHRIGLSLDGPEAAGHDAFRGVPGAFDATLRAIAVARAAGLQLQINSSVTAVSAVRLRSLGRLIETIRPALWSVFFVVPVGRAWRTLQVDAEHCERLFHWLYDWSERTGLSVKTTAAPSYRRVVLQREAERARQEVGHRRRPVPPGVNDGKGFVFISHRGDVQPSGFLPIRAGNVRHDRLVDLYRSSPLFRDLRNPAKLEGKCGACEFKRVCGGSRARAWATSGNYLAEDPACGYEPRGWITSGPMDRTLAVGA
jgi:radical SAM protein